MKVVETPLNPPLKRWEVINTNNIQIAAKVIRKGGLVIFPSDTVYILAVDPTNQSATEKLLAFKNRWTGKAISIAVADKKMAQEYVELSDSAENIYKNLLPGPFTIVSKGKHKVAKGIEAENGTLGIRIPDSQWIAELVKAVGGPVTATSANLSGRTPHYSLDSFLKTLSKKKLMMIDGMVDGGKLPNNKPSTVVDTTDPEIKILRRGDLIVGKSQILISKSEKETEKVAEFILKKITNNQEASIPNNDQLPINNYQTKPIVFGLSGDLGCGKTVFSRNIGKLLGVKEKITSPTFVIYNQYEITNNQEIPQGDFLTGASIPNKFQLPINKIQTFLHFDLYRLGEKYEFEEINFLENFGEGTVSCIEWPENMGEEYLERLKKISHYIPINFRYVDELTREIEFT